MLWRAQLSGAALCRRGRCCAERSARAAQHVGRLAHHAQRARAAAAPPEHARVSLYGISEKFAVGAWISHKTFGIGVVLRELATNKIEVRFDSGTKVLVHNTAPLT